MAHNPPGCPGGDWSTWEILSSNTGAHVFMGVSETDGNIYYSVRDEAGSAWRPVVRVTPL